MHVYTSDDDMNFVEDKKRSKKWDERIDEMSGDTQFFSFIVAR